MILNKRLIKQFLDNGSKETFWAEIGVDPPLKPSPEIVVAITSGCEQRLNFRLHVFAPPIKATTAAHPVGPGRLTTVGTGAESGTSHFPVRAPLVPTRP